MLPDGCQGITQAKHPIEPPANEPSNRACRIGVRRLDKISRNVRLRRMRPRQLEHRA
jgi:hypothetical protein